MVKAGRAAPAQAVWNEVEGLQAEVLHDFAPYLSKLHLAGLQQEVLGLAPMTEATQSSDGAGLAEGKLLPLLEATLTCFGVLKEDHCFLANFAGQDNVFPFEAEDLPGTAIPTAGTGLRRPGPNLG